MGCVGASPRPSYFIIHPSYFFLALRQKKRPQDYRDLGGMLKKGGKILMVSERWVVRDHHLMRLDCFDVSIPHFLFDFIVADRLDQFSFASR